MLEGKCAKSVPCSLDVRVNISSVAVVWRHIGKTHNTSCTYWRKKIHGFNESIL